MNGTGWGQHLIDAHQQRMTREAACERLSLEEQAARGVLPRGEEEISRASGGRQRVLMPRGAGLLARLRQATGG